MLPCGLHTSWNTALKSWPISKKSSSISRPAGADKDLQHKTEYKKKVVIGKFWQIFVHSAQYLFQLIVPDTTDDWLGLLSSLASTHLEYLIIPHLWRMLPFYTKVRHFVTTYVTYDITHDASFVISDMQLVNYMEWWQIINIVVYYSVALTKLWFNKQ